jgi:hypothetical protein
MDNAMRIRFTWSCCVDISAEEREIVLREAGWMMM